MTAARGARGATPPRLVTRDFVLLTIGHFLQAVGYSTSLLLPLYLEQLGATRAAIGTLMAVPAIGGLLARPIVAWALDVVGRRPTLVVGTVLLTLGLAGVWFVTDLGWWVYADRIIYGLGIGALFTGYFTWAADIVPVERRTEGLALFGVSGLLPLMLNAFVDDLGFGSADLRVFFPIVGMAVAMSLPAILALKEPPPVEGAEPVRLRSAVQALSRAELRATWVATITFSGLVATFFAFSTVAADARHVSEPAAHWLTYALGAATVRIFGARLPDRIGPANLVAPALACYGSGFLVAAQATSTDGFLVAGLLAGIGHGYCFPVLTSQVVSRMPDHLRGTGLAMFTALWEVSSLALAPAFGVVSDRYGDTVMFAAATCTAVAGLVVWAALEHRYAPARPARRTAASVEGAPDIRHDAEP